MKKRYARLIAGTLAAILALGLSLSPAGAAETIYAAVTGTDSLNLRADASSGSKWLGSYDRGAWVTVTGSKNNFYAVTTTDGKAGYMSKNYLASTDRLAYGNVTVVNNQKATAFLNLRAYPSYSASVITILYNGVPLNVLSESDGWYYVQLGDVKGHVRSEFTNTSYQPLGANVATIKTPNNTAVNMRVAPNSGATVRRQFSGDRYVSVLIRGSHWWYVGIDGYAGFVSSDFLTEGLHAERDEAWKAEGEQGGETESTSYATVTNPVSTQKLNLRELPSTAADIVAQLGNGTKLTMLEQGTEWCRVYTDGIAASGYVMTRYLTFHNLPSTPTATIVHPQGLYVNLRGSPAMTASVLAQMPNKSTVKVIVPGQDWMKVEYKGLTGYVITYFTSAKR